MNGSFVTFVVGSVRHSCVCGFGGVDHPAIGLQPARSRFNLALTLRGYCPLSVLGSDAKTRHHLGDHEGTGGADPALPPC